MYRRYTPKQTTPPHSMPQPRLKPPHNQNNIPDIPPQKKAAQPHPGKKSGSVRNPLSGFIPSSLYNPETQKVLGLFSAEDLLIAALIFLLLENDEDENNKALIYALAYILISDYIDLPF